MGVKTLVSDGERCKTQQIVVSELAHISKLTQKLKSLAIKHRKSGPDCIIFFITYARQLNC